MADPHASTIAAALRTNKALARLFDKMGNTKHPRGRILAAYRQARQAIRGSADSPYRVRLILEELERSLRAIMAELLAGAVEAGVQQGRADLEAHDLPAAGMGDITRLSFDAAEGWGAVLDGQLSAIYAMVLMGAADEAMLLGGEDRLGMLTPLPVISEGTRWLGMAATDGARRVVDRSVERAGVQDEYMRQAIAAIDERTTDCCLRVHGQTTTIDGDFTLTGTPRFADRLHGPPFHWNCRTAVALVRRQDTDDELSQEMRDAANAELKARAEAQSHIDDLKKQLADLGKAPDVRIRKDDTQQVKALRNKLREWKVRQRQEIHPAHARSGR